MKNIFLGLEFTITNINQILNMGGPWTCTLSLKDKLISDHCIVDNVLVNEPFKQIYFVKYNHLSKWSADNYFTINLYDIVLDEIYQFDKRFEMLYIKKFINPGQLEIYKAFHDQLPNTRQFFDIIKEPSEIVRIHL